MWIIHTFMGVFKDASQLMHTDPEHAAHSSNVQHKTLVTGGAGCTGSWRPHGVCGCGSAPESPRPPCRAQGTRNHHFLCSQALSMHMPHADAGRTALFLGGLWCKPKTCSHETIHDGIDYYRGDIKSCRNIEEFACFLTSFLYN